MIEKCCVNIHQNSIILSLVLSHSTFEIFLSIFLFLRKSLKVFPVLQLQDLAVKPAIRDPRLNTAECVIEGHKTDISTTGPIRRIFVTIILWSPVGFTFVSCPLLAIIFENYRKVAEQQNNDNTGSEIRQTNEGQNCGENGEHRKRKEKKKKFAQVVCNLCCLLAVTGLIILSVAFVFSICYCVKGELRWDVPWIPLLILIESIAVFMCRKKCLAEIKCWSVRFTICASVTSYLACWLLIGIMINPTWGLTVTLLLVFFLAAVTFARYKYLIASENKGQVALSCVCFIFAVIFLIPVVVMAGQTYYGRETADETLKTVLLSVIGALLSWLSWKKYLLEPAGDSPNAPQNDREMQLLQSRANAEQPLLADQSSSNLNE